jgi:site-specific recombinase XerC
MRDLNYQLKQLCRNNRDGSYATQAARAWQLSLMANQLHELGFRHMNVRSLKEKHVRALVALWKKQGIKVGTMKNRLSTLRWWARHVGKPGVVANDNSAYDIGNRSNVPEVSKAVHLTAKQIAAIQDERARLSVRLQIAFGLRREESIKFKPSYAMQDDNRIRLKANWCKGGRARTIPITNDEQRALLKEVADFAGGGSLIPPDKMYVQQQRRYDRQVRNAGLSKLHGLRHAYAHRRFEELTGFKAPIDGGPASRSLTSDQRALNKGARETIALELGHKREQISAAYLGR